MTERWDDKQQYIRARLSPGQYITEEEEEKIILQQVCMSFIMKMLAVSLLVIAMMALTDGAALSETQAADNTEPPPTEKEVEPESTLDKEAEEPENGSDEDTEDDTDSTDEDEHKLAKRSIRCTPGWSVCGGRCFRYFADPKTWAEAQRHCQSLGGNLASVHTSGDDNWLKSFAQYKPTWIGLSDAQQDYFWFWSDGTRFSYSNWCHGEPNNYGGNQECLQINWTDKKCWDDIQCDDHQGYVCVHT